MEKTEGSADSTLVGAAKAIGATAGKIATAVGVATRPPKTNVPKLAKKNKSRLPRRQKKAAKKAAAAKQLAKS
jgi:hypothetical protein